MQGSRSIRQGLQVIGRLQLAWRPKLPHCWEKRILDAPRTTALPYSARSEVSYRDLYRSINKSETAGLRVGRPRMDKGWQEEFPRVTVIPCPLCS
jgi:hypothetical protein